MGAECLLAVSLTPTLHPARASQQYLIGIDVLHMDVKPTNVLVGFDGNAVVCDLGKAREYSTEAEVIPNLGCLQVADSSRLMHLTKSYDIRGFSLCAVLTILRYQHDGARHHVALRLSARVCPRLPASALIASPPPYARMLTHLLASSQVSSPPSL